MPVTIKRYCELVFLPSAVTVLFTSDQAISDETKNAL